ncbi:MAG: hypothetical protein CVU51_01545 [Deltaproteobacteria bacterium HGW-Deltaproteobacteria-1]|nr:MAG: hypothetical protein CVU51_01545 [Deltaproteobacteria bacterium HGW-Deltaproteobacteria-1]
MSSFTKQYEFCQLWIRYTCTCLYQSSRWPVLASVNCLNSLCRACSTNTPLFCGLIGDNLKVTRQFLENYRPSYLYLHISCGVVFYNLTSGKDIALNKKPLVFGIGQCSLDYIGRIPVYPPPDVKCEFSNLVVQGGGPVATALVALKRWGVDGCIAGVTGDDDFGAQISSSLMTEGIDTGGLFIRQNQHSQFAFIVSEPATARRTIFWQRPNGQPLQPEELDLNLLLKCSALHTDGLFPEASLIACRKAKEAGIPVIVDAGTLRDGMLEIAKFSDCFVTSETFSNALSATPEETCRILAGLGVRFTGVTLGAKGYIALIDGRLG